MAQNPAHLMMRDPVCGVELDEERSIGHVDYKGQTYYFCSLECRDKFKETPSEYLPTVVERATQYVEQNH